MREVRIDIVESLAAVQPPEWDALTAGNPTLAHAWLQTMIDTGCTRTQTGWRPQFVLLRRSVDGVETLTGAVPLYMKGHSYGEYVFDWAWADAYQRAGVEYYPKLLAAVPFTPCNGARLLAATDADRAVLLDVLLQVAEESQVSSLHVLFATATEHALFRARGLLMREAVQFHWLNDDGSGQPYVSFEAFLGRMSHDKRKKIRQERRKVRDAGICFRQVDGHTATEADWDFFAHCYNVTYRAHHSTPYLNRAFFAEVGRRMPDGVLLIIAERGGVPIAASLNLVGGEVLYGRYWGTTEYVPALHFETCYYQGIEAAIARGLRVYEGGAQGEHKLSRGFVPVTCQSAHWIGDPRFRDAIHDFLRRESNGIARYVNELEDHAPFRDGTNA
jgi:predicted N-acyltransferase